MVDNFDFSSYRIDEVLKPNREKESSESVELFFSFDIVNSSQYKGIDSNGWQIVLTAILNTIQKKVTKDIPTAQLWRVLGDEILFFLTVRSEEEIYEAVNSINYILLSIKNGIDSKELFKVVNNNEIEKNRVDCQSVLGIQAAAWLAIVRTGDCREVKPYENVLWKYTLDSPQEEIKDFLGVDIDIGFRLKKETDERRFVISVELATILSKSTYYLKNLNIITYKKLKGVWNGRLYPIIWYHDEKLSEVSLEESFYYDEVEQSTLAKEYFTNRQNNVLDPKSKMYADVHAALNKIIKDQKLTSKIENINEIIKQTECDKRIVENEFNNKFLEFHCAAVCCNVETKSILIVKRLDRNLNTNKWEFGCAHANVDKDLIESIKEDYKHDFGIDIEVIMKTNRRDGEPLPIALYQIVKSNQLQKGVIVVAKVLNSGKLEDTIKANKKHSGYRWIKEEDLQNFDEDSVNDLKVTMEEIFIRWNELFGEKD